MRAGRERLRDVARIADAAVGDERHVLEQRAATFSIAVICGTPTPATMRVVQIEPGPMPTLTPSAPWSTSAFAPSPVATLPPMTSDLEVLLDPAHAVEHALRVAVRRVDDDHVDARLDQRGDPLLRAFAHADRRADAQPALRVLGGVGMLALLEDVLHRDQAPELEIAVDHQHALEAVLVHERLRFLAARAFAHRDQLLARRHDAFTG